MYAGHRKSITFIFTNEETKDVWELGEVLRIGLNKNISLTEVIEEMPVSDCDTERLMSLIKENDFVKEVKTHLKPVENQTFYVSTRQEQTNEVSITIGILGKCAPTK